MGGGVEVLVGDAIDLAVADGAEVAPVALVDDAGERDAIARATPGEKEDVGIGRGDGFGCCVRAGSAEEVAAGYGD